MATLPPIFIECDGAMARRECGPSGPLVAAWLVQCQAWANPFASVQAGIDYGAMLEGFGYAGPHLVSIACGTKFWAGRMEGKDAANRAMVGSTADELVAMYERGLGDVGFYHNFPAAGWVGSELDNTRLVFDAIRSAQAAGRIRSEIIPYLNWEWVIDPFDTSRIHRETITRLLGSAKFLNQLPADVRAMGTTRLVAGAFNIFGVDFPRIWAAIEGAVRATACRTAAEWMRSAGHWGRYVVSNCARPDRACVRFDGRTQPPIAMGPSQLSHLGWYFKDGNDEPDRRVRMATWVARAPACFDDPRGVVHHFEMKAPLANTAMGLAAVRASGGMGVVWGDPADLGNLPAIADAAG